MDRRAKQYGPYYTQMTWCSDALQQNFWINGSKYGSCGELFFLMQKEPYVTPGDFVSSRFDAHEFMRWFRQESLSLLRDFQFAHDSELA